MNILYETDDNTSNEGHNLLIKSSDSSNCWAVILSLSSKSRHRPAIVSRGSSRSRFLMHFLRRLLNISQAKAVSTTGKFLLSFNLSGSGSTLLQFFLIYTDEKCIMYRARGDLSPPLQICMLHIHNTCTCTPRAHIDISSKIETNFHSKFCNIEKHALGLIHLWGLECAFQAIFPPLRKISMM